MAVDLVSLQSNDRGSQALNTTKPWTTVAWTNTKQWNEGRMELGTKGAGLFYKQSTQPNSPTPVHF